MSPAGAAGALAVLVLAAAILLARPRTVFALVVGALLLVPSDVLFPGAANGRYSIHRLLDLALLAGLVLRAERGLARPARFRLTAATVGLAVYVVVALLAGVVFVPLNGNPSVQVNLWLDLADQLLILVCLLALLREIDDPWWALRVAAFAMLLLSAVGVGEHLTGASWQRLVAKLFGQTRYGLEVRGGHLRARGELPFALSYAWTVAAGLPAVVVLAVRSRRRLALLLPLLVVAAVVWTFSRSGYAALAVGVVVLVVASRFERRLTRYALAAALAALVVLIPSALLRGTFHAPDTAGSNQIRVDRLPIVAELVSGRPWIGKGFTALEVSGFQGVDSGWVLAYVDLGVLGLLGLGAALAGGLRSAGRGLSGSGDERLVAAAGVAGFVVMVGAGFAFDQFFGVGTAGPMWLWAALAISVADRRGPERSIAWRLARRRWWLPAAGLLAGLVALGLAPRSDAVRFRFSVRGAVAIADARGDETFIGAVQTNTTCRAMRTVARQAGGTLSCSRDLRTMDLVQGRLAVPPGHHVDAVYERVTAIARQVTPAYEAAILDVRHRAVPAWAATAPGIGAAFGLGLALLVPVRRRAGGLALRQAGRRLGAQGSRAGDAGGGPG